MDGLECDYKVSQWEVRIVNLLAIVPKCHSGISNYYSVLPVKASIQGVASERCHVIQFLPLHSSLSPFCQNIHDKAKCVLHSVWRAARPICAPSTSICVPTWRLVNFQLPILFCREGGILRSVSFHQSIPPHPRSPPCLRYATFNGAIDWRD